VLWGGFAQGTASPILQSAAVIVVAVVVVIVIHLGHRIQMLDITLQLRRRNDLGQLLIG